MLRTLGDLTEAESRTSGRKNKDSEAHLKEDHETAVGDVSVEVPTRDEPESKRRGRNNGGAGGYKGVRAPAYEPFPAERARRAGRSWLASLLLILILAGVAWYAYPTLRQNYSSLEQLPSLEQLVKGLEARTNSTAAQLRDLSANWENLQGRVAKLDRRLSANLAAAHKQAAHVIEAVQQLRAEMNRRTQVIDARLDQVESSLAENRNRIAQVQDQLQKEVAGLREQMAGRQDNTDQNLANLHEQVNESQNDLHALAREINRQRLDFEVSQNTTSQLAPGVSLTVLKTDVGYQNFRGYLSLTNEGRTLWLSEVGIDKAVTFYARQTGRPYDLVVTSIRPDGIVGFLMVPEGASQG